MLRPPSLALFEFQILICRRRPPIKAVAFEGKPDTVARLRAIPLPALSQGPLMVQWTLFYIARYNATTYNQ
jgi:hypothetical protein